VSCQLRVNLRRRTKRWIPQRERQSPWVDPRMTAVRALDFMRDTRCSSRVFRTLNVIGEAHRGGLGVDVAVSNPAGRVTTLLTHLVDLHGRPSVIRCACDPELTSQTVTDGCEVQDIEMRVIQPGKPDQNTHVRRFNRTGRQRS
jgi:putative transposase